MALLRVCQRSNAFSTNWKLSAKFSSSQSPQSDGDDVLPYWHAATGGKIKDFKQMPGPKYLPFIGHDWRYNKRIGIYDRDYANRTFTKMYRQYGNVVKEYIGRDRVIVHLFHPDDMRAVYRHDGLFPNRMSHRVMARYRKERPDLYNSPGLGPSNDWEWRTFREEFVKQHGLYLLKGQTSNLESVADDLITRVQSNQDKNGEVDVMPFLFRWTLESVGTVTLRRRLGCLDAVPIPEADRLIEASHITNEVVYRTEMTESTGLHEEQYRRLIPAEDYFAGVIRKYIDETIEELPRSPENEFLSTILKPETKLNDLYTFVLDLFHAGIHSTAVTTAFALYHLALNRDVQEKLRQEVLKELPTKESRYAGSQLARSNYLFFVIRETLRLNPPTIGNGRVLQNTMALGGYNVPASTMVLLHHQVASLQEENFGDAQKFIPERWSREASPDMIKNPTASMPFGNGHRQCVGQALGREEIKIAVCKFLRNFDISYHHEKLDVINRLHNEPDKPVRLRLRPLN